VTVKNVFVIELFKTNEVFYERVIESFIETDFKKIHSNELDF